MKYLSILLMVVAGIFFLGGPALYTKDNDPRPNPVRTDVHPGGDRPAGQAPQKEKQQVQKHKYLEEILNEIRHE